MIGPYGWIIGGVLWAASIAAGTLWGTGVGDDRCVARQKREDDVEQRATAAAVSAAASAIATIKVTNRTIQNEVQREISERVVYRDCGHTSEQLQRLNAALSGREPAGTGLVPPASAPSGLKLWSNDR